MPAVLTEPPAAPALTAQELELEHAELLPARETLWMTMLYPYYNPGGPMVHHHPNPPFDVPQYDA
jgi:hypothetical protein